MGDRIVVMRGGEIQQVASPMALYERPVNVFVGSFIGSPAMSFLDGALGQGEVAGDGYALALTDAMARRVDGQPGQPVKLGLRPEIFSLQPGANPAALRAVVDAVEPLGAETIVNLRVGAARQHIVARLGGHVQLAPEQALTLYADMARVHLFDAASERNISLEPRPEAH